MTSSNRMSRQERMKEKAYHFFLIYYQMGPDRSITKLFEFCTAMGLKISENTLKRYSVKYEWQRKLLERQVALREEREKEALTAVDKMNEDHIRINKGLMGLAIAGINYYQNQLDNDRFVGLPQSLKLSISDIVQLVRQSQLGERLARGEATNRAEIVTEVIGTFVQQFALIFIAVNNIADSDERKQEYIRRCDEMLREVYTAQVTSTVVKRVHREIGREL